MIGMELLEPPRVVDRAKADCLGIRVVTPFRGMLRVRDELLAELDAWLRAYELEPGPMDMEVGVVTAAPVDGDDRVRRTELPAGQYATLTYRTHARRRTRSCSNGLGSRASSSTARTWPRAAGSRAGTRPTAPTRAPSPARPSGPANSTCASRTGGSTRAGHTSPASMRIATVTLPLPTGQTGVAHQPHGAGAERSSH